MVSALDFRNTAVIETQTRIDQDGRTSVLIEDTFSVRITPRVTLLARGNYLLREGTNFSGVGLGGVVVLGRGVYSELMYMLRHFGEDEFMHRIYSDVTYESAAWLGNFSATMFISSDSWSLSLSPTLRVFRDRGDQIQLRYIQGIAPESEELLSHFGLAQYTFPAGAFQVTLSGGGGSVFDEEDDLMHEWVLQGELGWNMSEVSRLSYGISYNSSTDGMRLLSNRLIFSTRW